jgi:phosphoglycerate dehydrogenase-like enzyme
MKRGQEKPDPVTTILVHLREDAAPYRRLLVDSEGVRYRFCRTVEEVAARIAEADVILGSTSFPADLLPKADRLRWVQVTGAGVDRFLSTSVLPDDVVLTRADVAFGDQIAEYVIGHLLAVTQRMIDVVAHQRAKRWEPLELSWLKGRTIGIAGAGSIGRAVAGRAVGMHMRALGYARTPREVPGFERVYAADELDEFLSELDVLVLCLPLTSETRDLIGRDELALMKPTAVLVNVARGPIVDEGALIDALAAGRLAHAVLDVFENEPLPPGSPLWEMPNVTVTSHHSGLNIPEEIAGFFLDNLERYREGRPLRGVVDPKRGY